MAEIKDWHVEWRVVDRLRALMKELPDTRHDVTLTYSLFTTTLCWACQRIRDPQHDAAASIWTKLQDERAFDPMWGLGDIKLEPLAEGDLTLSSLPASDFLVGLRNATAHGDDRQVKPLHIGKVGLADRRLIGFDLDSTFYRKADARNWGRWRVSLPALDMRRIGLTLASRFCDQMSREVRDDARRHVQVA
jgi:hypothetical protein